MAKYHKHNGFQHTKKMTTVKTTILADQLLSHLGEKHSYKNPLGKQAEQNVSEFRFTNFSSTGWIFFGVDMPLTRPHNFQKKTKSDFTSSI